MHLNLLEPMKSSERRSGLNSLRALSPCLLRSVSMSYESYVTVTFSVIFFAAEQGLTDAAEQGLTIHRNSETRIDNWSKLEIRVVPKHFLQGNGCLKALRPRSPVLRLMRRSQTDLVKHTQKTYSTGRLEQPCRTALVIQHISNFGC